MINSHKSIIFLNGTFLEKEIFNFLNTKVALIASDGAIQKMKKIGLSPDYLIGDMDSCKKSYKDKKTCKIKILDQNYTDFEKSLLFAYKKNLSPSLIVGVNGGEIDHIVGNMQIMLKYAKKNLSYFLDSYKDKDLTKVKLGIPVTNRLSLKTEKKRCLSIITFEKATISTKGLKWELSNKILHTDTILGLRNETISEHIEIVVKKGKALIILDIKNIFFN